MNPGFLRRGQPVTRIIIRIDVIIVVRLESYFESCSSFFPSPFLPSGVGKVFVTFLILGINQTIHASHFPTLPRRIHEVARGNRSTTCLRVDRRLSRFCARLTAVCAELRLRSPRLTVPGRIRVSLESSFSLFLSSTHERSYRHR